MASKRKRGEVWEYTVKKSGVLPKPIYLTFRSEKEGDAYCARLESLLDKGIIPAEHRPEQRIKTLSMLVSEYERDAPPSAKDAGALGPILKTHGPVPLLSLDNGWSDAWISAMKRVDGLAPATVRARVGAVARCLDWGIRKGYIQTNPLRSLPDGYSQYTPTDATFTRARVDVERDRRLEPGEFERIMAVIDSGVIPRRQRPRTIEHKEKFRLLVVLAVETAMRLREMYTLSTHQINLSKKTVFLDKTKNGDKRQVPLSSVALEAISVHMTDGLVFPWWDGDQRSLVKTSDHLSKLFASVADAAGCDDLRFHDLRHEAICRLYERTKLSDIQISKISGHRSLAMLRRYSNLRGSDLASALW